MRALTLARQDLRLTLRDRSSIFWIFIAPFLWVFFFGSMNRSSGESHPRVTLQVNQMEETPLAQRLVEGLRAESFDVRLVKPGDAPATDEDEPPRSLTIPAGFEEAVKNRRKVQLELKEKKRANPDGTFAAQVALHRVTVRLLAAEALGGLDPEQDAVSLRSSWAGGRGIPSGYYQTIPGNLVMFVLIATVTYGAALLAAERRSGILRRLSVSPLKRSELIAGKVLGRVAMALVQIAVFLFIGLVVFRIDWGSSPLGLVLLLTTFVFCAATLGMLGGTLFTSPDAASGVGIVLVLAMAALGGCWWPAEVMPRWLQTASYAFPTAWAMNGLHQLVSWGGGVGDVLTHCAVLALFALGAGSLAVRNLRASS